MDFVIGEDRYIQKLYMRYKVVNAVTEKLDENPDVLGGGYIWKKN